MADENLIKKLKVKPDHKIAVFNAPKDFIKNLKSKIETKDNFKSAFNHYFLFVESETDLSKNLIKGKKSLTEKGTLWICYPKKSSKISSDLNRDKVFEIINKNKLKGITLISIDDNWSAFGTRIKDKNEKLNKTKSSKENKFIDYKNRTVTPPDDLLKKLKKNKEILDRFNSLAFSHKKEYVLWITETKKEETRKNRIEKTIEKLKQKKKNPFEK